MKNQTNKYLITLALLSLIGGILLSACSPVLAARPMVDVQAEINTAVAATLVQMAIETKVAEKVAVLEQLPSRPGSCDSRTPANLNSAANFDTSSDSDPAANLHRCSAGDCDNRTTCSEIPGHLCRHDQQLPPGSRSRVRGCGVVPGRDNLLCLRTGRRKRLVADCAPDRSGCHLLGLGRIHYRPGRYEHRSCRRGDSCAREENHFELLPL